MVPLNELRELEGSFEGGALNFGHVNFEVSMEKYRLGAIDLEIMLVCF